MQPPKKPTQLQAAKIAVRAIDADLARVSIQDLDAVVDAAQNQPPEGFADGSIGNDIWFRYRDIAEAGRALIEAIDRLVLAQGRRR
jgi:hypothetical protein